MRVLIVTSLYNPYILGGAEISSQILSENLAKKGIQVDVLTIGKENIIEVMNLVKVERTNVVKENEDILTGTEFKGIRTKFKHRIGVYFSTKMFNFFYNYFEKNNYDLIHVSNPMRGFYPHMCWKAANKLRIPVVQSIRDTSFLMEYEGNNPIINLYKKSLRKANIYYLNKYTTQIHFPSNFIKELFEKEGLRKNGTVIYNAVEDVNINKDIKKKNQIIYVGRLSEKKGVYDLIKIFKELEDKSYSLVLIGNEESSIGPMHNVEVIPWLNIKEVYKRISESKVLVLPSKEQEAFGRTLLEGILNHTLVIGRKIGAIPEILNFDDRYLFLSESEFKTKLTRVLKLKPKFYNEDLLRMQGSMEKFTVDNHINSFINLYEKVISGSIN